MTEDEDYYLYIFQKKSSFYYGIGDSYVHYKHKFKPKENCDISKYFKYVRFDEVKHLVISGTPDCYKNYSLDLCIFKNLEILHFCGTPIITLNNNGNVKKIIFDKKYNILF